MLTAGQRIVPFTLTALDGKPRNIADLLANSQALLVFYKVSCPTCQLTLPYLPPLEGSLPVVYVSQDGPVPTTKFISHFKVAGLHLLDERHYPVSNAFGIDSVPSLFLINPDLTVAKAWTGFSKADMIELSERAGKPLFTPQALRTVPEFKPG